MKGITINPWGREESFGKQRVFEVLVESTQKKESTRTTNPGGVKHKIKSNTHYFSTQSRYYYWCYCCDLNCPPNSTPASSQSYCPSPRRCLLPASLCPSSLSSE